MDPALSLTTILYQQVAINKNVFQKKLPRACEINAVTTRENPHGDLKGVFDIFFFIKLEIKLLILYHKSILCMCLAFLIYKGCFPVDLAQR